MYRQYRLRSDDHRLTCWLATADRLRVGTLVRLRGTDDEARWWEVIGIDGPALQEAPHQRWRVGGLT